MTADQVRALLADVERADVPSPALDRAVARAFGWREVHPTVSGERMIGKPAPGCGWALVPQVYGSERIADALKAKLRELEAPRDAA